MLKSGQKGEKIYPLAKTYERFKHLDIGETINFHLVFDALNFTDSSYDVFEVIDSKILANFASLNQKFNLSGEAKIALMKLAKSDRKKFNIYKIFSQPVAKRVYKELFEAGVIIAEKSLEKPVKAQKGKPLKKHLRGYKVEDKIHFTSHFLRFWFRFIEPNLALLEAGGRAKVLEIIKACFDEYASIGFEMLCRELLAYKFSVHPSSVSSLWTREVEIDLFLRTGGRIIVGEAKFKEHKMCKNILNLLLKKCERLNLTPHAVALFSKSGFSGELERLGGERILLFSLRDFEELL